MCSQRLIRYGFASALVALMVGLAGCGVFEDDPGGEESEPVTDEPQPTPDQGQSSFVSAAGSNGQETQSNFAGGGGGRTDSAAPEAGADQGNSQRQIQEGDIYRVLDQSSKILNLNRYRGLQVIDFTSPSKPNIVGRARISGQPVEMYLVGDQVYALLNDWRAYYSPSDQKQLMPTRYNGGVVAVIDISDPTDPTVTSRARVPGHIETSRITRGNGKQALFVVANESRYGNGSNGQTYVRSFNVSGRGKLDGKSTLELGGNVADIQGADNHLLVARDIRNQNYEHQGSKVSVIDISDPSGTMVEGGQVQVEGRVQNKHNMDLDDGILRVVSGATWNGARKNHLETFDASDIQNLQRVDHASFAEGERLEATLFMDDRAFVVTIEQIDPFFTFSIDKNGQLTQKSEFKVSGWNDYFVPVSDDQRLVGIGMNNEDGWTMAVSLYDASNLTNSQPMIQRREVSLEYSSSEANRDDRAFSVLENATHVKTDDGTVETGLVLLPYNGWDDQNDEYVSGVQIFTFSKNTLTKRGTMQHGTPVRRSFMADQSDQLTGNLSESELSLFDTSDPRNPTEQGRLELAPNYSNFWTFGNHGVRRNDRQSYYRWYAQRTDAEQTDTLEVVSLSEHPDTAETITSISIPAGAHAMKSGDRLVVAEVERTDQRRNQGTWKQSPVWKTKLQVWDFANPTSPTPVGSTTTTKLVPHYSYGSYGGGGRPVAVDASVGPGYYPYYGQMDLRSHAVKDGLVFVGTERERKLKGTLHTRYIQPDHSHSRSCYGSDGDNCTYYTGYVHCTKLVRTDGSVRPEHCQGAIRKCTSGSSTQNCQKVDPSQAPTTSHTNTRKQYAQWKRFRFHTLDLSNPSSPSVTGETVMPKAERDVSYLAQGSTIYVTHRKSYDKSNDSRPYYKYFYRPVDYSTPTNPKAGKSVNIPGELIAVDGETIVTRDYLWGEEIVENSINKLTVRNKTAFLEASHRLEDRQVDRVALDGQNHVLVNHRLAWRADGGTDVVTEPARGGTTGTSSPSREPDDGTYLSVLDLDSGLAELSKPRVADWATLQAAQGGRALFEVPGGMLIADLTDARQPVAQAYFPIQGWSRTLDVKKDGRVFLAAGQYGLYRFRLSRANLLVR